MNIVDYKERYDCIVVGGGTAGFAGAVTAARKGLKTLLVEEKSYLGGTATGARIGQLMGYAKGEADAPQKGILKEVLEKLIEQKGSNGIETIYLCGDKNLDVQVIPYQTDVLEDIIEELVFESGCDVLLHTCVIDVEKNDNKITSLIIHNNEGIQRVYGDIIIDASFHGVVAAAAGCEYKTGDNQGNLQPATLMYEMEGVDAKTWNNVSQPQRKELALKGIEEGKLIVNNLLARPLPNGIYYSNMSRLMANPLDTKQWSKAEYQARKQVKNISQYFIDNVPGFKKAHLVATGSFVGLRDSRRIMGKYVLTNEDVLEGKEFDDAVVASSYPIDIHDSNGASSTIIKPKTGVFYIPYRSLVTDQCNNLILAGRCISAQYEAHACIRVMITCMRLGECAGLAAYYSKQKNIEPNVLDGSILKKELLG